MIVLDASVLIAHLDSRDAHHDRARRLIADTGSEMLGASQITVAETLVAPARAGRLKEARSALDRLGVVELALGDRAADRLAQLRADTTRKLPDCCVLLAAQEADGSVATFDAGLLATASELGLQAVS